MATRTVRVELVGDASSLISAAQRARDSLTQLGNTNTGQIGAGFRDSSTAAREMGTTTESTFSKLKSSMSAQVGAGALMSMGLMSAFFAVREAISSTISAGVDYQTTLYTIQAVTNANVDTMSALGTEARALGTDMSLPATSATDAAKAMLELAKGGLSVTASMTAARGTLALAAAAQIDAASAAEIQVNALNAFNLSADQAGHVADVLANASNQASGDITDFGFAMTAVGATAHSFGIGIEDTNTVLGLFANAGVKGEEGGTLMKTMLVRLAAATGPAAAALDTLGITAYDAGGNFEGTAKLTQQLADAHGRLSMEAFNAATAVAFGTRGIKGAAILAGTTTDAYDKMSNAINTNGSAVALAAAKMQGLGGAFENLKNQVQDAQLKVMDTAGPGLTAMVNAFAAGIPALISAAMGGIDAIAGKIGDLLSPVVDGIKRLFESAQTSDALHILGTDLAAVGSAALSVFGALEPLTTLVGNAIGWFSDLPAPIQAVGFALGAMVVLHGPLSTMISGIVAGVIGMGATFNASAVEIEAAGGRVAFTMGVVGTAAKGMWTAMGGWIGLGIAAAVGIFSLFSGGADTATVAVTDLSDAVDTNTGKLKTNAQQILATLLAQDGSLATYQSIGGVVTDYTAALTGNAAAQDLVHTKLLDVATAAVESSQGWQRNSDAGMLNGKTARDTATDILAGASAAWLGADAATGQALSIGAVVTANQNFAAESDNLAAKQAVATLAIQAGGQAAGGAASAVSSAAAAQSELNIQTTSGVDPTSLMTESLKGMKQAATDADTASQFLYLTLIQMAGGQVTAEAATRANEAAFRAIADAAQTVTDKTTAVNDAVNKYGAESPQAAAATRDLKDAQDGLADSQDKAGKSAIDMAGAAYQQQAAQGNLQGAVAAATQVMQDQRDKFIAAAEAAGATAGAAQALADKEGLIPANVTTTFNAQNLATQTAEVDALNKKLEVLNGRTLTYTLVGNIIYQDLASSVPASALAALHAEGGLITGPGGPTTDSIVARLSAGEFVVNAAQTAKHRGLLESINNAAAGFSRGGLVTGFAAGGTVTPDPTTAATAAPAAAPAGAPSMMPDSAGIAAAWKDIADTITGVWTASILPTFDLLDQRTLLIGTEFTALDVAQTQPLWTNIAATVWNAWAGTISPTYSALDGGTVEVGNQWTILATNTNANAWNQIAVTVWNAWAGTISPTYEAINAGTVNVGATVLNTWAGTISPTYAAINAGTQNVGATVQNTWAGQINPTFDAINNGANNVGATWQNLANTTAGTWSSIGNSISATYNNQIVPAWNGVQGFANATGAFFAGIAGGMNSAQGTTTADLSQIQGAIDNFFAMVDSKAPVAALADGGIITQGTGPRADDVTVRVSRGEYVVNADATARHKTQLDAINYGGYADGGMIGYADGGMIGDKIGNRVENAVVGGVERAFDAGVTRILASVAATIAGYTPGGVAGARGKFLDAVASKMGTAYVWGAAGPDVFDCSGLMSWGLEQAGVGVGRLTAQDFNAGFAHIPESAVVPGDLVTFDTGRLPGQAGHIGAVMDVTKHLMMNTDGSGPAGIADYASRDGGPLSFIDPIGGTYQRTADATTGNPGDPPSAGWLATLLTRIKAGGTGAPKAAAGNVAFNVSAGVEQWRNTVLEALSLTQQSPSLADTVLHQMDTESSGNPNSINLTDSNAQRGTPSEGLLQVIQPTFDSYAMAPYNQNIWDPLSNIIAAIRYTIGAYGGVAAGMQGHAYAAGGIVGGDGKKGTDTVPAWLTPGEAVISRTAGMEKANKGYLDQAASWFGGRVVYGSLPPQMPPATQNGGTTVHHHYTGQQGGVQVDQITAAAPGNVLAELDFAAARMRR